MVVAAVFLNIHLFPINAWHTSDGIFLIVCGWWALDIGLRTDRARVRLDHEAKFHSCSRGRSRCFACASRVEEAFALPASRIRYRSAPGGVRLGHGVYCCSTATSSGQIGYDSPTLLAGSMVLLTLDPVKRNLLLPTVSEPNLWIRWGGALAAAATVVVVVAGFVTVEQAQHPYRDRPRDELAADLGTAIPDMRGIESNVSTFAYLQQIRQCIEAYPAEKVASEVPAAVAPTAPIVDPSGVLSEIRARLGGHTVSCGSFVGVWAPRPSPQPRLDRSHALTAATPWSAALPENARGRTCFVVRESRPAPLLFPRRLRRV